MTDEAMNAQTTNFEPMLDSAMSDEAINTEAIRHHLMNEASRPLVLKGLINEWTASDWTPESLAKELPDQKIRFRIGKKTHHGQQWETDCEYVDATIFHFIQWLHGNCCHDNPLHSYGRDQHWCYADYKYMVQMFADKKHLLKGVDWGSLGFSGRDGTDSTWWLGSAGAYTVCHYDTYGTNLVAQLHGRKSWTLFAPEDTSCLYPTRLPYEESSVFSDVNIQAPNLLKHPRYKGAAPYRVTLEPGDVLFVPRQWWHFVQSLDTSISVNTWVELESDVEARLHEAVTRLLACSIMKADGDQRSAEPRPDQHTTTSGSSAPSGSSGSSAPSGSQAHVWLNPTEVATDFRENMTFISQAANQLRASSKGHSGGNTAVDPSPVPGPGHSAQYAAVVSNLNVDNIFSAQPVEVKWKPDQESVCDGEEEDNEPSRKLQKLAQGADSKLNQDVTAWTLPKGVKPKFDSGSDPKRLCTVGVRSVGCKGFMISEDFEQRHVIRLKPGTVDADNLRSGVGPTTGESHTTINSMADCEIPHRDTIVNKIMSDVNGSDEKTSVKNISDITVTDKDIVNCVLHPNVIDAICKNLHELFVIK